MKYSKAIICVLAVMLFGTAAAQYVKIPKNANRFTYYQLEYGDQTDTSVIVVERNGSAFRIVNPKQEAPAIRGYAQQEVSADWVMDSITVRVSYEDSTYYYRSGYSRGDVQWKVERGDGPNSVRYTCSINSNTLVFEMDTTVGYSANPLPWYGLSHGVLRSFTRNGQRLLVLAKAERVKGLESKVAIASDAELLSSNSHRVSPRQMDQIMKNRLVITTRIFDNVQLHWGEENARVEGDIPYDTVLHFAGGTLALKRVKLPVLPRHYQTFVELHQRSNGDAYDRTGSVFVIPQGYFGRFFTEGILEHPDSLPILMGRDGERYQGVACTSYHHHQYEWVIRYHPPVELMRFFTPFGVGHYNERMAGYGPQWRNEAFYRQEVTDLGGYLQGDDVLIGVWIGNYDGGGHIVSLDLKSYPGSTVDDSSRRVGDDEFCHSLFNTCNVLEMAGQNYGKLFGTDSLTVSFIVRADATTAQLRYISTGHGGWGEGDEFVPKQNTLLIDGKVAFQYTPWRGDCGCYRDLNPVSGNFWNGLSSSDLSRSGWCPGTATQPVYFDLMPWADGREHTLTVAIPQGQPVEGMFSHWAVSGVLIVEWGE